MPLAEFHFSPKRLDLGTADATVRKVFNTKLNGLMGAGRSDDQISMIMLVDNSGNTINLTTNQYNAVQTALNNYLATLPDPESVV